MIDPIAKCRCGRTFTPMQWAELDANPVVSGLYVRSSYRNCPCGLFAVRLEKITLEDITKNYRKILASIRDEEPTQNEPEPEL